MKYFYVIMIMVFIMGFTVGAWVFFPAERVCLCYCEDLPEELFLFENYTSQNGSYYSDIDNVKPLKYVGGGVFVGAE